MNNLLSPPRSPHVRALYDRDVMETLTAPDPNGSVTPFEQLVRLHAALLEQLANANSEAFAADDAASSGDILKAEQHFGYATRYRRRAAETEGNIGAHLQTHPQLRVLDAEARLEAEARRGLRISAP